MVSGQVSESVHKGDYQAGTCAIGEVPLNFLSFFFFQVKLLCPGTSSKFAWAGSTLVSLISGIGLTLVVALLAYLGLVLRRRWSKRDGVGEDLEQDASGDEAERLQNVHLELEERVRGNHLDLGGEEEEEEEGVLQADQLDIEDRQRSEN